MVCPRRQWGCVIGWRRGVGARVAPMYRPVPELGSAAVATNVKVATNFRRGQPIFSKL
ncbi:hypothetical protein MHPYR_60125 [uncultured Mycobacterium sp.]|uniref:Uncharacterized protein n=1 Tax=uncultured Mycobacterium sp. TaxID=171292 RepID=A0A1Y5PIS0_9MYCO|nr:hypothetical protein MHPYR_60125 [uncultured Mycobacterium sp.]